MKRFLAFCLALAPGAALALSCTPWSVTNAYLEADAAPERYVPVIGTLSFDENALPFENLDDQNATPPLTKIPARFEGHALHSRRSQDVPFSSLVILEVACFGPWCSSWQSGPALALLRHDADGYTAAINPCGGFLFDLSDENISDLRRCLRGGRCEPVGWE